MYPMPPILNRYFYTRALGTLPSEAKCGLHGRYYRLLFKAAKKPVAGGQVVSTLDCYAGSLPIESGILPLPKHACGEQ